MLHLTKDNFKTEVEEYNGTVLIDLWAEWCGPCRMLSPVLDEIERETADVKFCKINVDEEPELARMFKVESIPMLAIVRDNTLIDISIGYKPKDQIVKFITDNK